MNFNDAGRTRTHLAASEPAQGLAEYAIIIVAVSIAAVAAMTVFGSRVLSLYTLAASAF